MTWVPCFICEKVPFYCSFSFPRVQTWRLMYVCSLSIGGFASWSSSVSFSLEVWVTPAVCCSVCDESFLQAVLWFFPFSVVSSVCACMDVCICACAHTHLEWVCCALESVGFCLLKILDILASVSKIFTFLSPHLTFCYLYVRLWGSSLFFSF